MEHRTTLITITVYNFVNINYVTPGFLTDAAKLKPNGSNRMKLKY